MKYSQLVWATWTTIALVGTATAEEPPPGCLCTMAQCCDNETEYDCSVLDTHLGPTSQPNLADFCEPYLNGTMDATTGACDAILADPEFQRRFLSGGSSFHETSFMTEITVGASCSDLVSEGCPIKTANTSRFLIKSWQALSKGSCSGVSANYNSTSTTEITVASNSGCNDENELDIFSGAVPRSTDLPACPDDPNVPFTEETSMGVDQQRWTCYEYNAIIEGETTAIRNYYVNLGNFACTGPPVPTASPVEAPSADPPTSSATSNNSLEALSFLVLGLLVSLLTFDLEFGN